MRVGVLFTILTCGLLVACSDTRPSPAANSPTTTSTMAVLAAPPPSSPGDPTPENESTPQSTFQEIPTPSRAADSPAPVQNGPLTIVALGDSLTEGDGEQPEDRGGYPACLQKFINEVRPNSRVINLGKSGWGSEQMVAGQLPSAIQANPQIALVWIGSNDLWNNNGPDRQASDVARYKNNIDRALRALRGTGAQVFIALLDDQSQRPYATSSGGAGLSPEGVEQMSHLGSTFNDAIRTKATEYGATTVDFYNTKIFTDPATLAGDGIHPNASGYDLVAQIWSKAIRQNLKSLGAQHAATSAPLPIPAAPNP